MRGNLFEGIPVRLEAERFETLLERAGLRLERIVSHGQATPEGQWFDQDGDEWVVLLSGRAVLRFNGEPPLALAPGDWVWIAAHRRHRVEWTSPAEASVWLALHLAPG